MMFLTIFLLLLGAAGLCYPRRPQMTGMLVASAGGFLLTLWLIRAIPGAAIVGVINAQCLVVGLVVAWKFRDPAVRAAHIAEWTRQS